MSSPLSPNTTCVFEYGPGGGLLSTTLLDEIPRVVVPVTTGIDPISTFVGTDTSGLLTLDGIHPNREGEQRLTEALFDSLVPYRMGSSS